MGFVIFIGLIVFVIVAKFLIDRNNQKNYIIKQGGMKNKYQLLIDKILKSAPELEIIEETNHDITLGTIKKYFAEQTTFTLTQAFRRLIVEWKVYASSESSYGNHDLKWEFDEFKNQEDIFNKINNDIRKYSINIIDTVKNTKKDKTENILKTETLNDKNEIKSYKKNPEIKKSFIFKTDLNIYIHRNNENAFLCEIKNIRKGKLRHLHIDKDEEDLVYFNKEKALKMIESWLNLKYDINDISELINSVVCTKDDYRLTYNESGSIYWEFDYTHFLNKDLNPTINQISILTEAVKNWTIPFDNSDSINYNKENKKMYSLNEMESKLLNKRPELKDILKGKTIKEKNKILLDILDNKVEYPNSFEDISRDATPFYDETETDNKEIIINNLKFVQAFMDKDPIVTFFIYAQNDSELNKLFAHGGVQFGATKEMLSDYTHKNPEIGMNFIDFLEKDGIDTSNYPIS